MFNQLPKPQPDAILSLMATVQADTRDNIIDLTVGVYKDDEGNTPVMDAVRQAERWLVSDQVTKTYKGLTGDPAFSELITGLVLGQDLDNYNLGLAQTPGGSGALRVLSELIKVANPETRLWLSDPTWANHHPLLGSVGLKREVYAYFEPSSQSVNVEAMFEAVERMQAGDVMVLHGCCHNPTGADLDLESWRRLGQRLAEKSVIPLIDLAYLGLGDGLEQDAAGLRALVAQSSTAMIAVSCSKNFGVYRDRVGCSIVVCPDQDTASTVTAQMGSIARKLYSMPPDHGASVIKHVLSDAALRSSWADELTRMQSRVQGLRTALAESLVRQSGNEFWLFIARQKGMFSLLGTSEEGIARLRDEHAVYLVPGGRVNVAGLKNDQVDQLAGALIDVMN